MRDREGTLWVIGPALARLPIVSRDEETSVTIAVDEPRHFAGVASI